MAKVAQLVSAWYPQNTNPVVITRILGEHGFVVSASNQIKTLDPHELLPL